MERSGLQLSGYAGIVGLRFANPTYPDSWDGHNQEGQIKREIHFSQETVRKKRERLNAEQARTRRGKAWVLSAPPPTGSPAGCALGSPTPPQGGSEGLAPARSMRHWMPFIP